MLQTRQRWGLSVRGRLVVVALVLGVFLAGILYTHPFLAVTDRTGADVLVVEGWLPNYALEESIAEFRARPYRLWGKGWFQKLPRGKGGESDNQASFPPQKAEGGRSS